MPEWTASTCGRGCAALRLTPGAREPRSSRSCRSTSTSATSELRADGAGEADGAAPGARGAARARHARRATCGRCGRRTCRRRSPPGAPRPRLLRRCLAGSALRGAHAAQAARLHRRRRPDAGARHRRQHRDLQPGQRHAASAAAGRRTRAASSTCTAATRRRVLVSAVRDAARRQSGRSTVWPAWGGITASLNAGDAAELVDRRHRHRQLLRRARRRRRRRAGCSRPADDVTPGAHPVAVISHDFWQTRFAGRPDIVGRDIRLNGHVFTIVGVAPAGFPGPQLGSVRQLYVPMMMQAIMRPPRAGYSGEQNPDLLRTPTNSWLFGIGRLKPGVDARAGTRGARPGAGRVRPDPRAALPAGRDAAAQSRCVPIDEGDRRISASRCASVGAAARRRGRGRPADRLRQHREPAAVARRGAAARAGGAAGARREPRPACFRQLLTESVLLSLIGGVCRRGAGVGGASQAFQAAPPPPGALPLAFEFAIDRRVLLFSLLLSMRDRHRCSASRRRWRRRGRAWCRRSRTADPARGERGAPLRPEEGAGGRARSRCRCCC